MFLFNLLIMNTMSKKLSLGLLILIAAIRPLSAQINFNEVPFWIGTGSDSTLLIVDFQDGSSDSSYIWGYAYNGNASGEDLLNAVAAADENFMVDISSGFLNDITYGMHVGIGGQPDYWSIWSGADTAGLVMNSGIGTSLVDGELFAISYTDFNPAIAPGLGFAAYNPATFNFSMVDQWIGSGSDSMAFFIDFQLPGDSARLVFGYLFNDSVQASQILSDLDQNITGLTVSAGAFLNDISYNSWSGIGGAPNYWGTWSGTNVGNWYMNAGIGTYVKSGELFGCSYTDFAPALRPQVPLGLNNVSLPNFELAQISIFPNPANDWVQIELEGQHKLRIFNSTGQLVLEQEMEDRATLRTSDWTKGLYHLQIGGRLTSLLVK